MPPVEFICLAHSKKYSQRCVAGVRLDTAEWIRPISREKHGELKPSQIRFAGGGEPQNLDVISAWFGERAPVKNQPENWRIQGSTWRLICRPAGPEHAAILKRILFCGSVLFGNTADRVPFRTFETAAAKESLLLARPLHPRWIVRRTPTWKRQLRVRFGLDAVDYNLVVTDIPYDDKASELELGEYSSEQMGIQDEARTYFTISLGEPFDNEFCFKPVAAVIQIPVSWPPLE